MSRAHGRILATAALALTLTLAGQAQAQPSVEQQVDAIYKAWMAADTPQNRALAKKQGKPVEATLTARIEEVYPAVPGKVEWSKPSRGQDVPATQGNTYPLFKRQVKEGLVSGSMRKAGTLYYSNFKGPATLMITENGPAYRVHKGYRSTAAYWTGQVNRSYKHEYSKPRPLHWPLPKLVARAFPQMAKKLGVMRAKRMIRKAVRDGRAPSLLQVRLAFHRAQRAAKK